MKANSGLSGGGQPLLLELLFKNFAFLISMFMMQDLKDLLTQESQDLCVFSGLFFFISFIKSSLLSF